MSEAITKSGEAPATLRTRGRAPGIALWALQALLALQFAAGGVLKVAGDPTMVAMFADIGAEQWFRYLVGGWRSPVRWACWSRASRGRPHSGWRGS